MQAEGSLRLLRCESREQRAGLEALLCDPEVSRHLLVSFSPEQGLAGNGARFERNFAATWQRVGFGGVLLHAEGETAPAGFVALKAGGETGAPSFELYFGVARERWGRGLASAGLALFLRELERRFGPRPVRATLDAARNPAACRVLAKQGFRFERYVALADFATPELARGSALLELWRLEQRDATPETLAQAAFRLGQLREAAGLDRAELLRALDAAIGRGGLAERPGAEPARSQARSALAAGEGEARYAIYLREAAGSRG